VSNEVLAMKVIVSGGAGFVGSAVRRSLVACEGRQGLSIDKLAYAANPSSLATIADRSNYRIARPSSEEPMR
jgi:dTDP-glucose 4,6-dehydratase